MCFEIVVLVFKMIISQSHQDKSSSQGEIQGYMYSLLLFTLVIRHAGLLLFYVYLVSLSLSIKTQVVKRRGTANAGLVTYA